MCDFFPCYISYFARYKALEQEQWFCNVRRLRPHLGPSPQCWLRRFHGANNASGFADVGFPDTCVADVLTQGLLHHRESGFVLAAKPPLRTGQQRFQQPGGVQRTMAFLANTGCESWGICSSSHGAQDSRVAVLGSF